MVEDGLLLSFLRENRAIARSFNKRHVVSLPGTTRCLRCKQRSCAPRMVFSGASRRCWCGSSGSARACPLPSRRSTTRCEGQERWVTCAVRLYRAHHGREYREVGPGGNGDRQQPESEQPSKPSSPTQEEARGAQRRGTRWTTRTRTRTRTAACNDNDDDDRGERGGGYGGGCGGGERKRGCRV